MDLFEKLSRAPALLARVAAQVPDALARVRSGPFALVEHLWHIADLEREGFGERVRRLLAEEDPFLPDFDGERIARERQYLTLPVAGALDAFAVARQETLRLLRSVSDEQWNRSGRQGGVGAGSRAGLAGRVPGHDRAPRIRGGSDPRADAGGPARRRAVRAARGIPLTAGRGRRHERASPCPGTPRAGSGGFRAGAPGVRAVRLGCSDRPGGLRSRR